MWYVYVYIICAILFFSYFLLNIKKEFDKQYYNNQYHNNIKYKYYKNIFFGTVIGIVVSMFWPLVIIISYYFGEKMKY